MEKQTINVQGHSFELVMTSESEGYYTVDRRYDLYFKNERIATNLGSIKSCYNEAFEYTKRLQ